MDDYRLWHLGWANLRSTQICGTTPCGVMVGCLDEKLVPGGAWGGPVIASSIHTGMM
jgi:hypothetical protein